VAAVRGSQWRRDSEVEATHIFVRSVPSMPRSESHREVVGVPLWNRAGKRRDGVYHHLVSLTVPGNSPHAATLWNAPITAFASSLRIGGRRRYRVYLLRCSRPKCARDVQRDRVAEVDREIFRSATTRR
jgi:hypothetical protein